MSPISTMYILSLLSIEEDDQLYFMTINQTLLNIIIEGLGILFFF